jgi:hypothetical protein
MRLARVDQAPHWSIEKRYIRLLDQTGNGRGDQQLLSACKGNGIALKVGSY